MIQKNQVLTAAIAAKKNSITVLQDDLQKLEKEQWLTEELPELKKLVGTIWKYRNSYSCPTEPEDYFWIFIRIIKVGDRKWEIIAQEIQIDCYGELKIDTKYRHVPSSGWMRATKREWRSMIRRAGTILKTIGAEIK